jgi:hypothetical protein
MACRPTLGMSRALLRVGFMPLFGWEKQTALGQTTPGSFP